MPATPSDPDRPADPPRDLPELPEVDRDERRLVLAELQRQSERALDQQVAGMSLLDRKTQQVLGIAVASLAGGLALVTLAANRAPRAPVLPFRVGIAFAGLLNLAALAVLVEAYVGYRRHFELAVAPRVQWLHEKSTDRSWNLEEQHTNVIEAYREFSEFNRETMGRAAKWRRLGVHLLSVAVLAYSVAALIAIWNL
jgi:hypothetical protein